MIVLTVLIVSNWGQGVAVGGSVSFKSCVQPVRAIRPSDDAPSLYLCSTLSTVASLCSALSLCNLSLLSLPAVSLGSLKLLSLWLLRYARNHEKLESWSRLDLLCENDGCVPQYTKFSQSRVATQHDKWNICFPVTVPGVGWYNPRTVPHYAVKTRAHIPSCSKMTPLCSIIISNGGYRFNCLWRRTFTLEEVCWMGWNRLYATLRQGREVC